MLKPFRDTVQVCREWTRLRSFGVPWRWSCAIHRLAARDLGGIPVFHL